jgi:catechol 2,3-dioxygenase-like lactoylglutathione lyase family enzyme
MAAMDVLSSRLLLRPRDPVASQRFYRDVLGLAVYREFPSGQVFFLGNGLLEVSAFGSDDSPSGFEGFALWLQVRDVEAEHARLAALGVPVLRVPQLEPWGLIELWIADPDGVRIALVQVPPEHPIRRDPR